MQIKDWVDLLQAISILVGIWVGIAGLSAWRQEFISKRRIKLAEEWLASAYAFRDAIRSIRNPFWSGAEGKTRPKDPTEEADEPEVAQAKNRGYVFWERFDYHRPTIGNFGKMKYQVMARFGNRNEEIFTRSNLILARLRSAADSLARYWLEMAQGETGPEPEHIKNAKRRIWSSEDTDVFADELDAVIESIEKVVNAVAQEKHGLADMLNWPMKWRISKASLSWILAAFFAGTTLWSFYKIYDQANAMSDRDQQQTYLQEQNQALAAILRASHSNLSKAQIRRLCSDQKIDAFDKGKDELVAGQVILMFKGDKLTSVDLEEK
jgi:hypothetical protein